MQFFFQVFKRCLLCVYKTIKWFRCKVALRFARSPFVPLSRLLQACAKFMHHSEITVFLEAHHGFSPDFKVICDSSKRLLWCSPLYKVESCLFVQAVGELWGH